MHAVACDLKEVELDNCLLTRDFRIFLFSIGPLYFGYFIAELHINVFFLMILNVIINT